MKSSRLGGGPRLPLVCFLAVLPGIAAFAAEHAAAQANEAPSAERAQRSLAEIDALPREETAPAPALSADPAVQELYLEARELLEDGQAADAAAKIDEALNAAERDYHELPLLMAEAKRKLGATGEARTFAELAARLRPGAAAPQYLLGMLSKDDSRNEAAIRHFRTATLAAEDEPNNPRVTAAWYWLGVLLEREDYWTAAAEAYARFDEAIWETHTEQRTADVLQPLVRQHPRGLFEKRVALWRKLEQPEQAVATVEQALEYHPRDAYLARLKARTLLEQGQAAQAWQFSDLQLGALRAAQSASSSGAAAGADEVSISPLLSVGLEAAQAAGMLNEFISELEAGAGRRADAGLTRAAARQLYLQGQYAAAARLFHALAEAQPDEARYAWAEAASLLAGAQFAAATERLSTLFRAAPDQKKLPAYWLAQWLEAPVPEAPALEFLRARADARPDFAEAAALGVLAAAIDALPLAEKLYLLALELRSDWPLVQVLLARLRMAQYDWTGAEAAADAALAAAPKFAAAHYVRGVALAGLDEHEAARQALRTAVELQPDEATYALELGELYRQTNDLLAAQRYFQQALSAEPTNGRAFELLVEAYLGGGKVELARAQLHEAEERDVPSDSLRRMQTTLEHVNRLFGDEHLAALQAQLAAYPGDVESGLKLAAGLFLHLKAHEAYEVLEHIRAHAPEDQRLLSLLARVQARRLEFDAAIQLMETLRRRFPRREEFLSTLAGYYLADFRLAPARATLKTLIEQSTEADEKQAYRQQLIASFTDLMEYAPALELLEAWRQEQGGAEQWSPTRWLVLVWAGRVDEAIAAAKAAVEPAEEAFRERLEEFQEVAKLLQETPDDAQLFQRAQGVQQELIAARAALQTQRERVLELCYEGDVPERAVSIAREWREAAPDDFQLAELLANALVEAERAKDALAFIDELTPESLEAALSVRLWRAQALIAAGDVDQGLAEFESLLAEPTTTLSAENRDAVWQRLLQSLLEAERYDEALEQVDRWFEQTDRTGERMRPLLFSLKGGILQQAARMDEYIELARKWLELQPNDVGLNNDLGYTWVDRGENVDQATQMIRKAVAADPLRAAYLDSLGWAYYKQGNFGEARLYLERAVRLREGQDPTLYDHLGDACARLDDLDAAKQHWEKANQLAREAARTQPAARLTEVLARLREKLAALEQGRRPDTAPIAAEQDSVK